MSNCSFCGNLIKLGSGVTLIRNDSRILRFCKSKCEKNMLKLNRKSRNIKWTKFYEKGTK
ncbi:50S ribosomal protein L24e [Candidatus Woesearchaeota archaeon]|nr:50S ribosomal protein L24e [Candidatus Woesearchaeota archaeon]